MRPYPLFDIKRGAPKHTVLVTANNGIGKSNASYDWLWKMLQRNEGAGVVIIAANIALAKECESDLRIECERKRQAGLCLYELDLFVNYLDALDGNIKQPRVICCINLLHRVRSSPAIVIVDEADMVLANCNSDVMTNRKQVFVAAERIMGDARILIAMDAHINCSRVLEWFYMVRSDSELYSIQNAGVHRIQLEGHHLTPTEAEKNRAHVCPSRRAHSRTPEKRQESRGKCLKKIGRFLQPIIYTIGLYRFKKSTAGVFGRRMKGGKPTLGCNSCGRSLVSRSFDHWLHVLQAPSASLRYAKQLTEAAVSESRTSKAVMAFHGAQKSPEDKKRLFQAVADPDEHMLADLMTHTSVIGPGVSGKRPWYDTVVALAYNNFFIHMLF
jgi:hypothetical protein